MLGFWMFIHLPLFSIIVLPYTGFCGCWQHGSTNVAAHCQQRGCSFTFLHPPPFPRHSSGPSLMLLTVLVWHTSRFNSLSLQKVPCKSSLLPADGTELVSRWHQCQCNRSGRSAWFVAGSAFWKHQTIRMAQYLTGLSHKYLAQQKCLRGCSMHPAFKATS